MTLLKIQDRSERQELVNALANLVDEKDAKSQAICS